MFQFAETTYGRTLTLPPMKQPKRRSARKPTKSPPPTERKEDDGNDTDDLLEEVQESNAQIPDPAERERVIPSRPC
jgi:hypothetical protein